MIFELYQVIRPVCRTKGHLAMLHKIKSIRNYFVEFYHDVGLKTFTVESARLSLDISLKI